MFKKPILYTLSSCCFLFFSQASAQDVLWEKFEKALTSAYGVENFETTEIEVPESLKGKLSVEMYDKNLFKVNSSGKLLGFAYLGEAASMKRMFDYVVFFDKNLIIKKSKVLIYREDFGRQIGTRRWLSQFDGKGPQSDLEYGKNIAAISGATISASSMTRAVNAVLESIALLQKENLL